MGASLATDQRSLLKQARVAEDDGRYLDAIDLLRAALAVDRSSRLDRRLLHVRNKAFGELERSIRQTDDRSSETSVSTRSSASAWPPALPDPFPARPKVGMPAQIPEVQVGGSGGGADFDSTTVGGGVVHHGAVILRGLLTANQAQRLRDGADEAIEARDRAVAAGNFELGRPHYDRLVPLGGRTEVSRAWVAEVGGILTADAPLLFHDLIDAFTDAGLIEIIAGYLGERPTLTFNKSVVRRLVGSAPTWHQDGRFIGSEVRSLNVWLSLSDCGGDTSTAGLDVVPKRFHDLLDTEGHGSTFLHSIGDALIDREAAEVGVATPRFHPGDALVFDERFVHRTSVRPGLTGVRHAIESWFFAPSHFPSQYVPLVV